VNKIILPDFKINLFFDDFCLDCNPHTTELVDLCEKCKNELGPTILQQWAEVKSICDDHTYPKVEQGRKMLSGVPEDHINKLLSTQLQFNPDYYRILDLTTVEEESKDEMTERLAANRYERKNTQPKLNYPVTREAGMSNDLLDHNAHESGSSSSDEALP